jgi:opacity protein-like surface antigen
MHKTITSHRLSTIVVRAAAATFLAAAGTLGLYAQQSAGTAPSLPVVNFDASLAAPLKFAPLNLSPSSSSDDLNYSSSTGAAETASAEGFMSSEGAQPPPRRRYSRPNYNDSRTNADGSPKYDFLVGGGFGLPVGGTHAYLTTGWGLQVGGGRNLNKHFGVDLQFDYDHFGFQTSTLNRLLDIYDNDLGFVDQNGNPLSQLGGSSHVWSFTLNPRYTFHDGDKYGAYAVVGVGFYHKTATFTTPYIGQYCDPYYGYCYNYQADAPIDTYTSNAPGFNAGFGMTYKFSRFASQRFYAEARYVFVDNQRRTFFEPSSDGTITNWNVFPENSARTTYIPVKFGIRF